MYYEGNGNFICSDRLLLVDNYDIYPKVYRISVNGTASFVSKHNYELDGLYPTSLFTYNGETWATGVPYYPLGFITKYDINTASFNLEIGGDIVINNIPNVTMSKVWYILSAINVDGKIYCNMFVNDKTQYDNQTFLQCIGILNMETFEAEYLYSVPYSTEYLYTNIIDKK